MEQNIFQELIAKKNRVKNIANKATEFGWIKEDRKKEILDHLDQDVLTIGVIGQMKCGKSSFLNAFVFENDILPSATTPMTAALSVITYGEKESLVAEFYTENEWADMKRQASRSLESVAGNSLEESKIQAAQELVAKSSSLGSNIDSYLGKTKEDTLDNLIEYVGADGKFIAITKSVTIYYPKDYLKGVEIVDTPGFNDPIVSREERTKDFLVKADVVILMLYAGRAFDVTDRDILFKNVRQCGVSKVLIGINKYDIPYEKGEYEAEIKAYITDELKKACKDQGDSKLIDLLKETEPILLSAEMALLSYLPSSKISSFEPYSYAWDRYCNIFEISNQSEFRDKSLIKNLADAVRKMIEKEKGDILINKPIDAIYACGDTIKADTGKERDKIVGEIKILSANDDDLEEFEENIKKVEKRVRKKIDVFELEMDEVINNISRNIERKIDDAIDETCSQMMSYHKQKDNSAIQDEEYNFQNRKMKRIIQDMEDSLCSETRSNVAELCDNVEQYIDRYLEDYDADEISKRLSTRVKSLIDAGGIVKANENSQALVKEEEEEEVEEGNGWLGAAVGAGAFAVGYFLPFVAIPLGLAALFGGNDGSEEIQNYIRQYKNSISDVSKNLVKEIDKKKKLIIDTIKDELFGSFLNPLQKEIDNVKLKKETKEIDLKKAKESESMILERLDKINNQITEIKKI